MVNTRTEHFLFSKIHQGTLSVLLNITVPLITIMNQVQIIQMENCCFVSYKSTNCIWHSAILAMTSLFSFNGHFIHSWFVFSIFPLRQSQNGRHVCVSTSVISCQEFCYRSIITPSNGGKCKNRLFSGNSVFIQMPGRATLSCSIPMETLVKR